MLRALAFLALALPGPATAEADPELQPREILTAVNGRGLRLTLVLFWPRDFSLRIVDNAAPGDTARFARLSLAMSGLGAAAGCNGGFFEQHPFNPFGLMIAGGTHAGTFDPQSWLKGLVVVRGGGLRFEAAATFHDGADVTEALQSGPWLVQAGQVLPSADARVARRTFVCRDAAGRWALGAAGPCTLGELGAALRGEDVEAALAVEDALNFDGGPSTGLWVRGDDRDYSIPEKWPVRNYIALFPRPAAAKP